MCRWISVGVALPLTGRLNRPWRSSWWCGMGLLALTSLLLFQPSSAAAAGRHPVANLPAGVAISPARLGELPFNVCASVLGRSGPLPEVTPVMRIPGAFPLTEFPRGEESSYFNGGAGLMETANLVTPPAVITPLCILFFNHPHLSRTELLDAAWRGEQQGLNPPERAPPIHHLS